MACRAALLVLLSVGSAAAQNLLTNPDFEGGNAGFTSAYNYVAPPATDPGDGNYTVGPDNRAFNPNFSASYPDHTGTGLRNYMIVNGAVNGRVIWQQTATGLTPNQPYMFSFYLLNTYPVSKAAIQAAANGTDVGPAFTNPNDGGNWQLNSVVVNPGAGTSLTLTLRDVNLDPNGNDFGLDDVALVATPANAQLVANDVTASAQGTPGATALLAPLSATISGPAGATVASFTLVSVPASGTLRLGSPTGQVLGAGQVVPAAQANQLYYTSASNTAQTVTFAYRANDSNGATSANTATYSIPLTATPPPAGCGPSYLDGTTSYSGLTADYYAGYFNDNLSFFASNTPGISRLDGPLDFSGAGFGDIRTVGGANQNDPDFFSARYRGSIYLATAGSYTFSLTSDDASYLWLDGAALAPTLANAAVSNGGLHGSVTRSATVTLGAGLHNLLIYYGDNTGGNVLQFTYSGPGVAAGTVVPRAVLCAGRAYSAPTASSVTNVPVINTAPDAPLNPGLTVPGAASDPDGTVAYFTIEPPTSGTLSYGGLNVTVPTVVPVAQAATVSYRPDVGFVGNATFAFTATDNSGLTSNSATYTIPVVSAEADVTTNLTGPTTLGAGVSSGAYTVTYTNNGPQPASQVGRTVTLPAGSTLTAAQLAALPGTATYNAGTQTIDFGSVPVLSVGASSSLTFSFTAPTTQGTAQVRSNVTTITNQGANAGPDQDVVNVTISPGNFFVTNDDTNEVPAGTAKSGNVILNDPNPSNLLNNQFAATLVSPPAHGTVVLNADGSYTYTPAAGYTGPDDFTYYVNVPGATPPNSNVSTVNLNVYNASLVCISGTGRNLLANPNFSQGNTGFTSTYGYVVDDPNVNNELIPEGLYAVALNAANLHPNFAGFGHTGGANDLFMMVNGAQDLSVVYQQTVAVQPNRYYTFSAFANSINPGSPAQLGFVINGKSTSSVTTLNGTTSYVQIKDLWFSGPNTSAVIEIRDVNKVRGGNDFGLDDLYMGTCTVSLVVNNVTAPPMSNQAASTSIPPLSATVTNGPPVGSFTVQTLPDVSSGVLYFNGVAVVPGQDIDVADAGLLFFDPAPGFVGNAIFTYTATDDSGAGSNNTATYTIPVDFRPLPVELAEFTAKAAKTDALLNWTTASERNNDHFDVERSLDGRAFAKFATVAGQGTKATPTRYALADERAAARAQTVYYRLRQVDRDGAASLSPVRAVRFGNAAEAPADFAVYPNPAGAEATVELTALPAQPYRLTLTDLTGRRVLEATFTGGAKHPLDLSKLAAGTYLVTVGGADAQGQPVQLRQRLTKE